MMLGKQSLEKYNNVIIPYLLATIVRGESFVVTDPEDVILRRIGTKLEQNGYSIISINLRDPNNSNSWNPLHAAYKAYKQENLDRCVDLLNSVATIIMLDNSHTHNSDPFWELSSINLFIGLALILFREATDESQININSIYYMAQNGFLKFGPLTLLDSYFVNFRNDFDIARNMLSSILSAPSDTRCSIMSVFFQKIGEFAVKEKFSKNLFMNDIVFENIIKSKTAIFICYEDENNDTANTLFCKLFLKQLYDVLIKTRDVLKTDEKHFHFIFSNFLSLGFLSEIERIVSSAENRNINILFDIYSLNALYKLYGKKTSAFLLSHCSTWYIMMIKELELQLLINQFLKTSKKENSQLKPIFDLRPNEIMVVEDSKDLKIENVQSSFYSETSYVFKRQNAPITTSIFKFDDLVKQKTRDTILKTNMQNLSSSIPKETELNVDELIAKIDKKIAELEINEKIEQATKGRLK